MGPEDFPHSRAPASPSPGHISNLQLRFSSFPRAAFILIKSAGPVEGGHLILSQLSPYPAPPLLPFITEKKKKNPRKMTNINSA